MDDVKWRRDAHECERDGGDADEASDPRHDETTLARLCPGRRKERATLMNKKLDMRIRGE